MKKIGFYLSTASVTGGGKCILKMAAGLRRRGHKVSVYSRAYSLKNYLRHKVLPLRVGWTEEPHVIEVIRSDDDLPALDVMCATGWRTAAPVHAWQERTGGLGCYYIQHHEALWDGGEEAAQSYTLPLKKIVISSWLEEIMRDTYGQESVKLITPVDDALFAATSSHPERPKRVLMLHHTFDWKGLDDGLQAFERLKQKHPQAQLVMLGGREASPHLPADVEYHYQPAHRALLKVFASCGLFLCSSWHEGLGMPAMEAMATGALLVTTDTGGSRDYALPGETALVSEPRNVEALAAHLMEAYENYEQYREMRQRGQDQIRQFKLDLNLDRFEELIQD